jgi:hypothetical protein
MGVDSGPVGLQAVPAGPAFTMLATEVLRYMPPAGVEPAHAV